MTATRWADITAITNDIYEGALFVLREQNLLARTITVFNDTSGMNPRKVTEYGDANPRQVSEGDDISATQLTRTLLQTLTPAEHADQFLLTDSRVRTDAQNVRADAAGILGASFAEYVDIKIAANFSSLTGGTIGSAGGTIGWGNIAAARALAKGLKIPGPYWCALHPYQWYHLFSLANINATEISAAPQFQDRLTQDYFINSVFGDITFVISANIAVDGSDDAIGALYAPLAMAYDERVGFYIEPERDASRRAWELNAAMAFVTDVYDASRGIQLIGDASTPS